MQDVGEETADSLGEIAVEEDTGALYWIENGFKERRIVRGGFDGGDRSVIHRTDEFLLRIALDPAERMIYYNASNGLVGAGIRRIGFEGGQVELVLEREVGDIAVDGRGGRVYWVQEGAIGEYGTNIWWAALDGSDPKPIIHHPFDHYTTGIVLDPAMGKIYWATVDYRDTHAQIVQRANLDGSGIEPVTTANPGLDDWPVFLSIDPAARQLYWVNGEDGEFYRVSLDGGEAELLFEDPGPYGPFGLAVLASEPKAPSFRRGDGDGDGVITVTDPIATLGALFLGGAQLGCADAADANDDGAVDLSDAVAMLTYLFLGGFDIPLPGPIDCGADPGPPFDDLGCEAYAACSP